MNRQTELDLTRLLHGELPEGQARALRARIDREPELAEAWRKLEGSWRSLALPPASPVPPGFARRVLARAARARPQAAGLSWAQAPGWVRAAAATALVIGAAVGVGVGGQWSAPQPVSSPAISVLEAPELDDSLAESYWDALDDLAAERTGDVP